MASAPFLSTSEFESRFRMIKILVIKYREYNIQDEVLLGGQEGKPPA